MYTCQCKDDTRQHIWLNHFDKNDGFRWDDSKSECLHSPGSSSDTNRSREKYNPIQMRDEIDDDTNGTDDIDIIVQKIFGPLGMVIVIMVIIGVCIVLHNKKYLNIK